MMYLKLFIAIEISCLLLPFLLALLTEILDYIPRPIAIFAESIIAIGDATKIDYIVVLYSSLSILGLLLTLIIILIHNFYSEKSKSKT